MKEQKNHTITFWAVSSIVFAFIIHCLFSIQAPCQWIEAKWEAGDILTYVSTVALGLLALWQNQKFKEENDNLQKRIENLTIQSNELSIISKIIEIENDNLCRLKTSVDKFSIACDPQTIALAFADNCNDKLKIMEAMVMLENNIDNIFFDMCREMRLDPKLKQDDDAPVKKLAVTYYRAAKQVIVKIKNDPLKIQSSELDVLLPIRSDFVAAREQYLIQQEKKLSAVVYGNMSIEEIKQLYR